MRLCIWMAAHTAHGHTGFAGVNVERNLQQSLGDFRTLKELRRVLIDAVDRK